VYHYEIFAITVTGTFHTNQFVDYEMHL